MDNEIVDLGNGVSGSARKVDDIHLRIWTANRNDGESLCGKFWRRRNETVRYTVDRQRITCPKCLKKLEATNG